MTRLEKKYTVQVSVQVVGEIEVEANSFKEAGQKATREARFNRGEKLMSPSIDVDALSATNNNGDEHDYD